MVMIPSRTARKQRHTEGKNRRYVVGITLFRRHTDETSPRKFNFPRKSLGIFRRNSEETNFRGNSEDHQFVGKLLRIYRGRTSSGYFDGISYGPILGSSDEIFLGIFIGKFRGTGPSENSEERGPSEYSEQHVPRNIPRNMSLGIFRGICPSV
ncbi:hypothetical protein F2Q69_00016574 [Brassica cretica]|uniref:Uncharacterized protein n=1 Tax=Brassica cretica TaxID=69181 RepID=A0A8S9QX55_BRACR|nr:hypothetical protein F2Q69_00016574 [Brassica cretica]